MEKVTAPFQKKKKPNPSSEDFICLKNPEDTSNTDNLHNDDLSLTQRIIEVSTAIVIIIHVSWQQSLSKFVQ